MVCVVTLTPPPCMNLSSSILCNVCFRLHLTSPFTKFWTMLRYDDPTALVGALYRQGDPQATLASIIGRDLFLNIEMSPAERTSAAVSALIFGSYIGLDIMTTPRPHGRYRSAKMDLR